MKKFITVMLLLSMATPCMAMGRFDGPPPGRRGMHNPPPPPPIHRYERHVTVHRYDAPRYYEPSTTTKTFATIAGIAGIAMIISAIAD